MAGQFEPGIIIEQGLIGITRGEHKDFINDDGRFDSLMAQNQIGIAFRVAKQGDITEVKKWREKRNQYQNQNL